MADSPGVTRDRIYANCSWRDITFKIIDTGGLETVNTDIISKQMKRQANLAISMADVIIFLTDIKQGVTEDDKEIANMLRKTKKKVILVINKSDKVGATPVEAYEFYNLNLGDPYTISAKAKLGIGEILDAIYFEIKDNIKIKEEQRSIKVSIIGKPNTGKSSLINYLTGQERMVVSEIAGTTRDAVDTEIENKYGTYTLIDTAGIRKKNKIYDKLEQYSVVKAKAAIDKSDVSILIIDALEGPTDQDEKIAGYAHEMGKAAIIAVNKWDLIDKDEMTVAKYIKNLRKSFKFMSYAPVITISALTGKRVSDLFKIINKVYAANSFRISTSILNDIIMEATAICPPPTDKGRRLKIYYATQASINPPTFILFVNSKRLAHFSYIRHLENVFRKHFDLEGTPINIVIKERKEKDYK